MAPTDVAADDEMLASVRELRESSEELEREVRIALAAGATELPKRVQLAKRRNRRAWKAFRDLHQARWSADDEGADDGT